MASAALDRLLHRATVLNIKGDSYRLREKLPGRPLPRRGRPRTNERILHLKEKITRTSILAGVGQF